MQNFLRHAVVIATSFLMAGTLVYAQMASPPNSYRPTTRRFSGQIATVNAQDQSLVLAGPDKETILIATNTMIYVSRTNGTFSSFAAGQQVSGTKHMNSESNWIATVVRVGNVRTIPPEKQ